MTNFSFTCAPPSNYMHIYTKEQKTDVTLDFFFQTLKYSVAQTVSSIKKPSSRKKFVWTRSSKLDPIFICSGGSFFRLKVTTSGLHKLSHLSYISYRVIYTQKFTVCFQQTFIPRSKCDYDVCSELSALLCILSCCTKVIGVCFSTIFIPSVKKLPRYLYMSYQLSSVCIITLFTHELLGGIF